MALIIIIGFIGCLLSGELIKLGKFMLLLLVWDIVALFAIILRPNFKYSSDVISWLIAGIALSVIIIIS